MEALSYASNGWLGSQKRRRVCAFVFDAERRTSPPTLTCAPKSTDRSGTLNLKPSTLDPGHVNKATGQVSKPEILNPKP